LRTSFKHLTTPIDTGVAAIRDPARDGPTLRICLSSAVRRRLRPFCAQSTGGEPRVFLTRTSARAVPAPVFLRFNGRARSLRLLQFAASEIGVSAGGKTQRGPTLGEGSAHAR